MSRDTRLLLLVGGTLVAALLGFIGLTHHEEANRPLLLEARLVSAAAGDPVFRDGPRRAGTDDKVELAVALLVERPGEEPFWLAPVDELVLEGRTVEHVVAASWPERDRFARVFWFTVECSHVGGDLTPDNAAAWLQYRTFLAPEMGNDLRTMATTAAGNDDFLGVRADAEPVAGGTLRFFARVEVASTRRRVRALQAASTLGPEQLGHPSLVAIHRAAALPERLHPVAGELLLLPGFEPLAGDPAAWDSVPVAQLGLTFTQLVERRLAVSSRTFAAMTVAGAPALQPQALHTLASLRLVSGRLQRGGATLSWSREVRPGDLLRSGEHWLVLVADDGNDLLDDADRVLHSWRQPAAMVSVLGALTPREEERLEQGGGIELLRYEPADP